MALLAVAGYVTFQEATGTRGADCTVEGGGGRLVLRQEQAANAATIGAVAASRDLPERALTIALATAMQESGLHDLPGGDRDSLGLFQQRPSQGWGTARQILDPVYSANQFFDGLVRIPGYSRLPLTVAAQRVQHSGFPQAYAKHEADASLLASALSGRVPALSCRVAGRMAPGDPGTVSRRLTREFGAQVWRPHGSNSAPDGSAGAPAASGGTAGAPDAGRAAGDAGSGPQAPGDAGRTVTVPGNTAGEPAGADAAQHGWVLAQWAVAHAQQLRIAEVDYRGRSWRAADSTKGWTADPRRSGHVYGDVRITVQH